VGASLSRDFAIPKLAEKFVEGQDVDVSDVAGAGLGADADEAFHHAFLCQGLPDLNAYLYTQETSPTAAPAPVVAPAPQGDDGTTVQPDAPDPSQGG